MKTIFFHYRTLVYATLSVLIISCAKDSFNLDNLSDDAQWNPDLAVPVAYGNITMRELLPERKDTIVYYNSDDVDNNGNLIDKSDEKLIKLIYQIDSVANLADEIKLPLIEDYSVSMKLNSLILGDFKGESSIQFNKLLSDNFDPLTQTYYNTKIATGNPEDYTQNAATTQKVYSLPPHSSIDWAILSNGSIEIIAVNEYDVPVQFVYDLYTYYLGTRYLVASFDFTKDTVNFLDYWIQPNESESRIVQLNNQRVASLLEYELSNLSFGAGNNIILNPSDSLHFSALMSDIEAVEGRAYIPNQEFSLDETRFFSVREPNSNKQLFHIEVDKGDILYTINTNIQSGVDIQLTLPTVTKDGVPVSNTVTIGQSGQSFGTFDLSGTKMDLTQNPAQRYNSMPANLKFSIKSKSQSDFIQFDANETIDLLISNPDNLDFGYLGGFYRFDTVFVDYDTIGFNVTDYFKDYFEGEIVFTHPSISLLFDNPIGAKSVVDMSLYGHNKDGDSIMLFQEGESIFQIDGPDTRYDDIPVHNEVVLDNETANVVDLYKMMPNSLSYQGMVLMNRIYDGTTTTHVDTLGLAANPWDINFVTNQVEPYLGVKAELPLKFYMKDLILRQEFDVKILEDISAIERLRIYFDTKNGFPIDVEVSVKMLDTTLPLAQQELGLLHMYFVKAATADSRGKVEKGVYNEHEEELVVSIEDDDQLLKKFTQMNKLRVEVKLNTYNSPNDQSVSIYTYYGVDFKMALDAKFAYKFDIKKL